MRDTWAPAWSHDPHDACEQWSVNAAWGALKVRLARALSLSLAFSLSLFPISLDRSLSIDQLIGATIYLSGCVSASPSQGGQTIEQACATDFGTKQCTQTCCEALPHRRALEEAVPPSGQGGAFALRKSYFACVTHALLASHTHTCRVRRVWSRPVGSLSRG
jgi:hypothetical protein